MSEKKLGPSFFDFLEEGSKKPLPDYKKSFEEWLNDFPSKPKEMTFVMGAQQYKWLTEKLKQEYKKLK